MTSIMDLDKSSTSVSFKLISDQAKLALEI